MSEKPIRVLIVDANPQEAGAMPRRTSEVQRQSHRRGIEVVGVAHSRSEALALIEDLQPDVLVVDLMLPGMRSIELVRRVAGDHPRVCILAVAPDDSPHDRIMLAAKAGALGFISRHAPFSDYAAAIEQVHRGEYWLPPQQTYQVLQEGADELGVSSHNRRTRLTEVLLGLIPLTGLVAAITALL